MIWYYYLNFKFSIFVDFVLGNVIGGVVLKLLKKVWLMVEGEMFIFYLIVNFW